MDEFEIEGVRQALKDMGMTGRLAFAERCGVPFSTLNKFALGFVESPRIDTFTKIVIALRAKSRPRRGPSGLSKLEPSCP
jgi:predicted transcriptional regulator